VSDIFYLDLCCFKRVEVVVPDQVPLELEGARE